MKCYYNETLISALFKTMNRSLILHVKPDGRLNNRHYSRITCTAIRFSATTAKYHLELIIRARANIPSLHSRDDALALISIPLLERGAPIYHDGWRSGSVGWAAERKRCGSVDRKLEPEASRVNGRFSDCTLRSRPDKNMLVCHLRSWNSIAPNKSRAIS